MSIYDLLMMPHSQVHANLRSYVQRDGVANYKQECEMVRDEFGTLREDIELQISQLEDEVSRLTAELAAGMPSAFTSASAPESLTPRKNALRSPMTPPTGVLSGPPSAAMCSKGHSMDRDAAELEAVIAAYPLASEQVKASIRGVHEALQERFLEKLETWRLECEASGGLGSASGWLVWGVGCHKSLGSQLC